MATLLWTIEHHQQAQAPPLQIDTSNCDAEDSSFLSKSKSSQHVRESKSQAALEVQHQGGTLAAAQEPSTPKNTTIVDASAPAGKNADNKKGRKPPSPTWWKRYVPNLARAWQRRSIDSWCGTLEPDPPTPFLLRHEEVAEGMIYIKTYKASSSTCEGIAWSIAHHVGQRQRQRALPLSSANASMPFVCRAYTRHEFADNRMHARRHPTRSLLWTFVRNPAARDLSHIYHFEVGRKQRTDMTSWHIKKLIQTKIKGRQTRYLVPAKTSRAPLWPVHELRKNRTELIEYMNSSIFDNYDFIGLTERMTESLAVMVLLWDLQPRDVIVLNSKRSGGFDDGGHNDTCFVIPKAVITPELKNYFETMYPLWNADMLLYNAANVSLQLTIDALGHDRVLSVAKTIERLQRQAQELCLDEAYFPCSVNGTFQPKVAEQSCYVQDAGCGHDCVDRALAAG